MQRQVVKRISRDNPYGLTPTMLTLWKLTHEGRNAYKEMGNSIFGDISDQVRMAKRVIVNQHPRDPLVQKLKDFGNNGGYVNQLIKQVEKMLWESKKPPRDDKVGQYISIEVECIIPSMSAFRAIKKEIRKVGLSKILTLKHDSSIECDGHGQEYDDDGEPIEDNGGEQPIEIVLTVLRGHYQPIQLLCNILNQHDTYVNASCGLHVHFDYRHVKSGRSVTTPAKRVAAAVPALKLMLPQSRRNNRFCERDINTMRDGSGNRYAFVNLHSYHRHGTLEIRGHSGTTDSEKIINWIRILDIMLLTRKSVRQPITTIEQLTSEFKFGDELVAYMKERARKFKKNTEDSQFSDVVSIPVNNGIGMTVNYTHDSTIPHEQQFQIGMQEIRRTVAMDGTRQSRSAMQRRIEDEVEQRARELQGSLARELFGTVPSDEVVQAAAQSRMYVSPEHYAQMQREIMAEHVSNLNNSTED